MTRRVDTPTDPVAPAPLDVALDELYGVEPDAFVTTRKELVSQLRASGRGDDAAAVGSARRPTKAAWALNRLARDRHDLVERFLSRCSDLVAAQEAALRGDDVDLREVSRAHRASLGEALDAAVSLLGPHASDMARTQILTTLQSATTDGPTADALLRGRLVSEASFTGGGFGAGALAEVRAVGSGRSTPPAARAKPRLVPDEGEARRRRAALETELRSAEEAAARALREVAAREVALAEVDHRVTRLKEELAAAHEERRDAARKVREERKRLDERTQATERLLRDREAEAR
jgi:hypothetical protein